MPRHGIDLTQSPSAPPISQSLPSSLITKASTTKGLPPGAKKAPRPNPPKTQEAILLETIERASKKRLHTISAELLVPHDVVRPWKEGDDDVGDGEQESEAEGKEGEQARNIEDEAQDGRPSDSSETAARKLGAGNSSTTLTASRKRMRRSSQYATCVDCDAEFHVLSNEEGVCHSHGGILKKRSSSDTMVWDDWREDLYGEMDTEENRKEYPDGFDGLAAERVGRKRNVRLGDIGTGKRRAGRLIGDFRLIRTRSAHFGG